MMLCNESLDMISSLINYKKKIFSSGSNKSSIFKNSTANYLPEVLEKISKESCECYKRDFFKSY